MSEPTEPRTLKDLIRRIDGNLKFMNPSKGLAPLIFECRSALIDLARQNFELSQSRKKD